MRHSTALWPCLSAPMTTGQKPPWLVYHSHPFETPASQRSHTASLRYTGIERHPGLTH
jgi:hypothetical protein